MAKVCHMSSGHLPNDTRIFLKECRSLAKKHEVYYVVSGTKNEVVDGVNLIAVKPQKNRWLRFSKTAWDIFNQARSIDAEIYHFHDPDLIPYGIWLKKHGKKVIYDVHEDFPRQTMGREYIPGLLRAPVAKMVELVEDRAITHFDALVTATPFIEKRMASIHPKVVTVNNFPILNELSFSKRTAKTKSVAYVGAISLNRGLREMVQAIGLTTGKLELVGSLPESLKNSVKHSKAWKRVDVRGHRSRKEIAEILSHSMAGLVLFHPEKAHIDAQPTKFFEYLSAGLPIIASDFPLWRKFIKQSQCGLLVDPLNPKAIAGAIQWILEHPEKAEKMGQAGKKMILENYNWQKEENKLLDLYEELLT